MFSLVGRVESFSLIPVSRSKERRTPRGGRARYAPHHYPTNDDLSANEIEGKNFKVTGSDVWAKRARTCASSRGRFECCGAGSYLNGQAALAGRERARGAERRRYSSYAEIHEILVDTRDTWLEGVECGDT